MPTDHTEEDYFNMKPLYSLMGAVALMLLAVGLLGHLCLNVIPAESDPGIYGPAGTEYRLDQVGCVRYKSHTATHVSYYIPGEAHTLTIKRSLFRTTATPGCGDLT